MHFNMHFSLTKTEHSFKEVHVMEIDYCVTNLVDKMQIYLMEFSYSYVFAKFTK